MMNNSSFSHFVSDFLHEEYRVYHHASGLDIYIFPKEMTTTYALFGTKYGSIHNRFCPDESSVPITVPDGIAHFLEHKLFTCEDGSDAFERFSEYGADANAYTSFNKTCYLFSCTDNFEKSLGELLDFVTHPYFTEESVKKEVGIISEEIRMYDDNPSDRCYYGMLEAMYQSHSIRRNICGSVDSISRITPELLYSCYQSFYCLSNMALVVCGNVTDENILDIANRIFPTKKSADEPILCVNENAEELPTVAQHKRTQRMQVSKPLFNIGIKDVNIPSDGISRQRKDAAMSILDEMLFSRAGRLYNRLIEKNMISPSLSYGYSISESTAYNSIAGEADDPDAVLDEILAFLKQTKKDGLCEEDFLRGKRVMLAEFIKSFDSTDSIANNLFSFVCEDCEMFTYAKLLEEVTFDDVKALLHSEFSEDAIAISVILPLEHT